MKKIIKCIFVSILMIPLVVLADMGAPAIGEYKAEISNPNGVMAYDYKLKKDIKLEYGTVGTVVYEYENEDSTTNIEFKVNDINYSIDGKDVISIEESFDLNNKSVEKISENIIITSKDGLEIKNGPANSGFKSTGVVIPYLTKIKASYTVEYSPWYYIEYNGTNGWINIIGNKAVHQLGNFEFYDYKKIITTEKAKLNDYKGNELTTINENYELNSQEIYQSSDWDRNIYIEYNGVKGFISKDYITFKSKEKITINLNSELQLYKNAENAYDLTKKKEILIIPKNTTLETYYYDGDYGISYAYVEYNNIKGWIIFSAEEYDYDFDNNIINIHNLEESNNQNTNEIQPTTTVPITTTAAINHNEEEPRITNPKDIIIYCLLSALILSLTSLVTVVLVNKKKNRLEKSAEVKAEEVVELIEEIQNESTDKQNKN